MSSKVVLFCCNASQHIGAGHVMRCLSLAQRLRKENQRCVFLTNRGGMEIVYHHAANFFEVIELKDGYDHELISIAKSVNAAYIIWDSYEMSENEVTNVAEFIPLMVLDDMYLLPFYTCDAILNQNLYANADKYSKDDDTIVLAGSKYALLRDHFLGKALNNRKKFSKLKILLTFGGADPDNLTSLILGWLNHLNLFFDISVIIGRHFPFKHELYSGISKATYRFGVTYYEDVIEIADLFLQHNLVICAAGSTLYELAHLGIPSCCIVTAENQLELARTADSIGFSKMLGRIEDLNQDEFIHSILELLSNNLLLDTMSRIGRQTVDGKGAQRVTDYILSKII